MPLIKEYLQLGAFNYVIRKLRGEQFGLVNICGEDSIGMQFGIINWRYGVR